MPGLSYVYFTIQLAIDRALDSDRIAEGDLEGIERMGSLPADIPLLRDYVDVDHDQTTDEYTLTLELVHPGGRPLTLSDLPRTPHGRCFTDSWLDTELESMRNADDTTTATDGDSLTAAKRDGRLTLKLVVYQQQRDGETVDESLAELPIDEIVLKKADH